MCNIYGSERSRVGELLICVLSVVDSSLISVYRLQVDRSRYTCVLAGYIAIRTKYCNVD